MYEVFLFAGTTEGRQIAEKLREWSVPALVFTATEYGGCLIGEGRSISVHAGRLTEEEMAAIFLSRSFETTENRKLPGTGISSSKKRKPLVVDATHPYAALASENIRQAAEEAGLSCVRVTRKGLTKAEISADEAAGGAVFVKSTEEAADYLKSTTGNVLLTTGSKELAVFTAVPGYETRIFARVLSLPAVVAAAAGLGFQGRNLICMQGPFSEEMNTALIHQVHAKYLVTKDTGKEGGFPEKEAAAKKCGCRLVIIGRPASDEAGLSVEECETWIRSRLKNCNAKEESSEGNSRKT